MSTNAQDRFDSKYIGSAEICQFLGIHRVTLFHGRSKGKLPDPIRVSGTNTFLWERSEVKDMLSNWKAEIVAKRGSRTNV